MTDLKFIEGRWFIKLTNFPMWLKGDRLNPSFNYSIIEKSNKIILFDEVKFYKNGKVRSIKGFDRLIGSNFQKFEWKGKGLLSLFKSNWEIIHFNENPGWIIIKFEKTWVTPEGYDVICRNNNISSTQLEFIQKKLDELGITEKLTLI